MSDAPVFRVNPALNPQDYAETFRREGVVQIGDVFEPDLADYLTTVLKENTYWRLVHTDEKKRVISLTGQELAKLDATESQRFLAGIVERASTGFAYLYLACNVPEVYGGANQAEHPLHRLANFLNSPAFLDFGRAVIGESAPDKVDAIATWYRPGDFLNLHTDGSQGERRAAYTLGLTRGWRPDWGGQLLFHDQAGDVTRGLRPTFNVLTLFKTPRAHSVAQVATYATEPRLTISGWLVASQAPPA